MICLIARNRTSTPIAFPKSIPYNPFTQAIPPTQARQIVMSDSNPLVQIETSLGEIILELDTAKAPVSVANFVAYARAGHYDGTIFHRVIPGFMIQGGGLTPEMEEIPTNPPIANEAANKLKNKVGTIAMARTDEVDSATAQFFINTADNKSLDHGGLKPELFGYAVFGQVVDGMDVVYTIEQQATNSVDSYDDVPVQPVIIQSVTVLD
jgi:peptidyl-prolyl cis-trans isomerase B (cyclophilin B)